MKLLLTIGILTTLLTGITHNACCSAANTLLPFVQEEVTDAVQIKAAEGVIRRITPKLSKHFILEVIPQKEGLDTFELEQKGEKVILRGSSGVALCSAYNYYLQKFCKCDISWCGDQLDIPIPFPKVTAKVTIVGLHKYRAYFNYCTISYTASWWSWERWQREIDYMAMKGINMPLCPVGLEATWYYALLKTGLTDEEARDFFIGPANFAWQWMANIQGNPEEESISKDWIDSHLDLGQKIISRERSLGMIPIQEGFSGFVPRIFIEKFPEAEIEREGRWAGFEGTAQLNPLDPLFKTFGKTLLETEIELFGTSHHYAADPFHEGKPPIPGNAYLVAVADAIYGLMKEVDKGAIWVMQGWSFQEGIVRAVPIGSLLMLDLNGTRAGKRNEFFWGHEYVKGQLHNFGGRINLHGDIARANRNDFAKASNENENCVGMGLFMEGIEHNPAYYAAIFDQIWSDGPTDVNDWLTDYAERRYGAASESAANSWKLMVKSGPYRSGTDNPESSSIIAARPALHCKKSGCNGGFHFRYEPITLVQAWELLLADYDKLKGSEAYLFDLMDITRQVLSNLGQEMHNDVIIAFEAKDKEALKAATDTFLKMLEDVDELLSSRTEFSFGKWTNDARAWGKTDKDKIYNEWHASKLLSIWGTLPEPFIFDYAWREWSGLINTYYKARWEMFYNMLNAKLAAGEEYLDPHPKTWGYARETFRANSFYNKLADFELAWTTTRHNLPSEPVGDTGEIVKRIHENYKPKIIKAYTPERLAKVEKMKDVYKAFLHHYKVGDLMVKLGPENVTAEWTEFTFDVTKHVLSGGWYVVDYKHTKGSSTFEVDEAILLQGKEVVASDERDLSFGNKKKARSSLALNAQALNVSYFLKVKAKMTDTDNPSTGEIWFNKR